MTCLEETGKYNQYLRWPKRYDLIGVYDNKINATDIFEDVNSIKCAKIIKNV